MRDLFEQARADPTQVDVLEVLHDALAQRGDPRAGEVRALIEHLDGRANWKRPPTRDVWHWSLGLPVAAALAASEVDLDLADVLQQSRLAVGLVARGRPQGLTRMFGDPDLPPGLPWPTWGDCRVWVPSAQIAADLPCRFVLQIDLSTLPNLNGPKLSGLLSVFSFVEVEEVGTAGVVVHHFAADTYLERRTHPSADEFNCRLTPKGLQFPVRRTLPDALDVYLETARTGMFGHLRATTGNDPSPSPSHHRLLVCPIDEEDVMFVHLAISDEDLQRGNLAECELVWVDFHG